MIKKFYIILILLFLQSSLLANTQYFKEGVKLFNEKILQKQNLNLNKI